MGWCSVEDKKDEITKTLINNSVTLPSPLRSSAGSRRACRKQDSRGGAKDKSRRQKEREEEREERLEHEKP